MTIDEAIKHCEEVAEQNEWFDKNCLESMQCRECAKEHRQLAEWLKDYKRLLDAFDKIKAEISDRYNNCDICEWFEDYDYEENNISEYRSVGSISDIIEIIDKYKGDK